MNVNQTNPPTNSEINESVSTILFNKDETKLVIDIKGKAKQQTPGFLAAWDVNHDGSLSKSHLTFPAPTKTGQLNFGMTPINGKDGFIVTDPSVGGIIYDFSKGWNHNAKITNFELPGQTIVCWVKYASKSGTYFISDFGAPNVFEVSLDNRTNKVKKINQFPLPKTTINIDAVVGNAGQGQ